MTFIFWISGAFQLGAVKWDKTGFMRPPATKAENDILHGPGSSPQQFLKVRCKMVQYGAILAFNIWDNYIKF